MWNVYPLLFRFQEDVPALDLRHLCLGHPSTTLPFQRVPANYPAPGSRLVYPGYYRRNKNNWDFSEPHKIGKRHCTRFECTTRTWYGFWNFYFPKQKAATRLIRNNRFYILIFDCGNPVHSSGMWICDKNGKPYFIEQRRNSISSPRLVNEINRKTPA